MAYNTSFYRDLAVLRSFEDVAEVQLYAAIPDDWVIVLADIEASTKAVEAGRYKTVNLVGAAVITAVLNAVGEPDVPYVFGGDGAVVVVPAVDAPAARKALAGLKRHAREMFGLELRAGAVSVAAVRVVGFDVRVMKLALSGDNALAMFAGGGLQTAGEWLSHARDDDPMLIREDETHDGPSLDGLSCRWEPIAARHGVILSLITCAAGVGPVAERAHVRRVMGALADILGKDVATAAPVQADKLKLPWPPAGLDLETRATAGPKWRIRRRGEILLQSLIQKSAEVLNRPIGYYDPARYHDETVHNTDFQKYDDMLHLVLDVTMDQAARIDMFLRAEHASGRLFYGAHHAREALMTCLVFSLEHGRHVHFVDGAEGGFTLASIELKNQLRAAQQGRAAS